MKRNILCLAAIVTLILGLIFATPAMGQTNLVEDIKEFESWEFVNSEPCSGTHTHFFLRKGDQGVEVLAITNELAVEEKVDKKIPSIQLQGGTWHVFAYKYEIGGTKYIAKWCIGHQAFHIIGIREGRKGDTAGEVA